MNTGGMGGFLEKAQQMQKDLKKVQDELKDRVVAGESAGGMVKVYMTGQQDVKKIEIEPSAVDPDDLEMLEDLVLVAIKNALEKSKALSQEEMSRVTGGLNIPGLF